MQDNDSRSGNLITLFEYRQRAGVPPSENAGPDPMIETAIAAACEAIEGSLGRRLGFRERRQWMDGSGENVLLLPDWPIRLIYGVGMDSFPALRFNCPEADYAQAIITDTGVELFAIVNGVGGTDSSLTFESCPTIGSIADAAPRGWKIDVLALVGSDRGTPSRFLVPHKSGRCDGSMFFLAEDVSSFEPVGIVPNTNRGVYRIDGSCFPAGSSIFAWYDAGYHLPEDDPNHQVLVEPGDVPEDLKEIAFAFAKALLDARRQNVGAAESESTDGYSYTLGDSGRALLARLLKDAEPVLMPHRSGIIF